MTTEISYWVPVATALAGGGLVAVINFAMRWQDRKSEERRHLHELLLNAALEHWKQSCTIFIEKMKAGQSVSLPPIETNIIYLLKLADILLDTKITKDNIKNKLSEIHAFTYEVEKFIESQDNQNNKNQT